MGGVSTGRVVAVLLLVGCAVLLLGFLEGQPYRVRTVIVRGNQLTFADTIARESGVLGESVFRIDTQAIAERIAAHPAVAAVTVQTYYPDTVVIELVERVPRSVWIAGETSWLVDGQGHVIGPGTVTGLPVVEVDESVHLHAGAKVPWSIAAGLPVIVQRYGDRLDLLQYRADDGLIVVVRGGARIILGDAERLPEQLAVLDALFARGETWLHADLRDPDRPVIWSVPS